MRHRTGILMGMMLVVVALPARAQTADIADIMARMQEIISEMQALQSEFTSLSSSLGANTSTPASGQSTASAPSGAVLGAATSALQEEAVYGNTNDTITKIQTLLATDPLIYAEGTVSGFYGPKTQEAIRNLQARFGMNPVGVVGPSTSELLMEYFVAYPSGNYPDGVLKSRPTAQVAGAQTSTVPDTTPSTPATSGGSVSTPIEAIYLQRDDGETVIRVVMKNGDATGLAIASKDEDDIAEAIADKVGVTEAQVLAVLDADDIAPSRDRNDYDGDDVEDMIEEAEDAIEDAEDAIDDADGDTDDAEDLLEEAEELLEDAEDALDDRDYDEAYEAAEEARDLAEEAEEEAEDAEDDERDEAEEAIEDAEDAIDDAEEAIEEAEDDGEDVDDAEDLLDEAKDKLDDAEDAFDDGDYDEAIDDAEEAEELAEEAEDEL